MSHRSAAALWRIETLAPAPASASASASGTPLEFTDTERIHRPAAKDVRVHRASLHPGEVTERRGLRVTGAVRTLTDLLRTGPRDDALVALESALTYRRVGSVRRAPLIDLDSVSAALEVTPKRAAVRARSWLRLCDPRAGSPAETMARLRLYDAGLRPESQAELLTPAGRRVVLDFLFREKGLAIEIEGYAYHGTRDSHRRDVARFNQILQCPEVRSLLRYTAEDVFHRPAHMIRDIRAALTADASRPAPEARWGHAPAPQWR
ncbi:hypothetical protein [Streptomyces sp. NPDC007264]|uniref:hypothetical protein n=1 Tax=Streptomyces sp. NPDC007264 TaxID=3364777 RepID=UPI0036D9FB61